MLLHKKMKKLTYFIFFRLNELEARCISLSKENSVLYTTIVHLERKLQ
jgi:hypothetical protein